MEEKMVQELINLQIMINMKVILKRDYVKVLLYINILMKYIKKIYIYFRSWYLYMVR